MKYLSFFLVLSVIFCYTGLGAGVCYSSSNGVVSDMNMKNCHASQPNKISGAKSVTGTYKITGIMDHKACVCYEVVLNAPNSHIVKNIVLYPLAFDIPILQINRVPSFSLNLALKAQYRPPDLFLANSSLLL
jgi:hypothetical protein